MSPLTVIDGVLRVDSGSLVLTTPVGDPCCCCPISGLKIRYAAGGGDGHNCNAADFTCYASAVGGVPVLIGDVNLNNSPSGQEVVVNLVITQKQAQNITANAKDCCILQLFLTCNTPPGADLGWGIGKCHSNLARLQVIGKNANNQDVLLFNGQAGENIISLNACP